VNLVRDAVTAYRKGDLAAGDALRARAGPGASAALLEWTAIRFGGPSVGFERALAFMRNYPDWPGAANMRRRAEELLLAERKPAALVRAFFAKGRPQSASGKLALAEAFRADGLIEDARALVREAWRNDTFGRELEIKMVEAFGDAIDLADRRFRMERFLFRENWEAARRAADFAGRDYGSLVKARIAVAGRQNTAAKLIEAVPGGAENRPVLPVHARPVPPPRRADHGSRERSRRSAARPGSSRRCRRVVDRASPDEPQAARQWRRQGGLRRCGRPYGRLERAPHRGGVPVGWIALRFLNDPAAATRHFERAAAIAATPISIARVGYWQGRASEAAGQGQAAMSHYERAAREGMTYYGQLALAKLGRPVPDPRSVPTPVVGGANRERSPVPRAVELLYAANLREIVTPLLTELGRNSSDPAEIDAVADIVRDKGDARALLALGKAAFQRGLPLDDHAFPTIGIPPFEPTGPQVERAMVYAIARQESALIRPRCRRRARAG
jgi:soluble lytic murein transglycosylase